MRRAGWWHVGVRDPESVAEHSLRVAQLASIIAAIEGAEPGRAALLAVWHDSQETRTGDIPHTARPYLDQCCPEVITADQTTSLPDARPQDGAGGSRRVRDTADSRSALRERRRQARMSDPSGRIQGCGLHQSAGLDRLLTQPLAHRHSTPYRRRRPVHISPRLAGSLSTRRRDSAADRWRSAPAPVTTRRCWPIGWVLATWRVLRSTPRSHSRRGPTWQRRTRHLLGRDHTVAMGGTDPTQRCDRHTVGAAYS